MIDLRQLATGAAIATIALVVLLGARPVGVETILAGYALALAAVVLTGLTGAMRASRNSAPSRFEHELTRERIPPTRPPELVRVERELTLAASSGRHFHVRLRPLLRDIAEARLGVSFERRPDVARERLGERTWELLRPDVPLPEDPLAPGLPLRRVRDVVDTLERL